MMWRAPCGHVGTPVIGAYVACDAGCDGKPKRCGRCGSEAIRPFVGLGVPVGSIHCLPCGWVAWSVAWCG